MSNVRQLVNDWVAGRVSLAATASMFAVNAEQAQYADTVGDFLGIDTSSPSAKGRDIFADPRNLPTAIATIMTHTQNKADFHPAVQTPEVVAVRFAGYITGMDNTPFFHLLTNDYVKQTFKSKDYNQLIDQVVSLYDGVSESDKAKLKTKITDMAKSVFSQSHSEKWENLFSQATIDYSNPNEPKLYIFYTTLHMKHEKNGKSEVSEQEYTVNRVEYSVLPELIRTYADKLSALVKADVDDWMNDSSSPSNPAIKLCFEKVSA
ncbi:hypothetical protein [Plesiomonas shigelloides]|uniref:hypothetical protein n=1 Tax=Plesiomonas shigelloides TaxID=703 RepID=UPI001C498DC7|nr:hypothetical protein [Plesiomonas shigelloides]